MMFFFKIYQKRHKQEYDFFVGPPCISFQFVQNQLVVLEYLTKLSFASNSGNRREMFILISNFFSKIKIYFRFPRNKTAFPISLSLKKNTQIQREIPRFGITDLQQTVACQAFGQKQDLRTNRSKRAGLEHTPSFGNLWGCGCTFWQFILKFKACILTTFFCNL